MTIQGEGLLDRALRVLACFSADEPELGSARLAQLTGLPSSSLHRLLGTLVGQGLLVVTSGRRFAVGTRLWELGELAPLSLRLRETALPHMQRLYETTGENVHLAVLDGARPQDATALFVGRIAGTGSIGTLTRMGGRHPLHTTGVGKALLADRDDDWLAGYLARPLARETTRSIIEPAALRDDLARTRTRGYAVAREEMTLGNVSVAASLPRIEGLPASAIGLVVHLERADERRLGALVVQAARDLGRDLRLH